MYTCQCEGFQMGQSNDVLFKEVSTFQSCPLIEILLCTNMKLLAFLCQSVCC